MNLMMMSALRDAGIETIVAFDILDSKLSLAKEFGATHTFNSAGRTMSKGHTSLREASSWIVLLKCAAA